MGSRVMIYVTISPKTGSGIKKLMRGTYNRHTHRQQSYFISLLLSFKNKEIVLKKLLNLLV
jgi:hypothetical protein